MTVHQKCTVTAILKIQNLLCYRYAIPKKPAIGTSETVTLPAAVKRYPTSSRIAFFTWVGTGAYFRGSMTELARPWLMERSSVV